MTNGMRLAGSWAGVEGKRERAAFFLLSTKKVGGAHEVGAGERGSLTSRRSLPWAPS